MNLELLDLAEQQLRSRVEQATGPIEEKHEQLAQGGVYAEYRRIYEAYAELIESESEGLEALKRATFLLWYEQTEPACFSGVCGLSEEAGRKVRAALERRSEGGGPDCELKWMLPFYNKVADWVFSLYADLPHLRTFLAAADPDAWRGANLKVEGFANRGQMGAYWASIITSWSAVPARAKSN